MQRHVVAGGAGFIAVTLIESLLTNGSQVLAIDDLSRGERRLIARFEAHDRFRFVQADCSDTATLTSAIRNFGGADHVWHLAANSDIPAGIADPRIDLEQTFMTTFTILEVMRREGIGALHFASSSAIYGDQGDRQIDERAGPLEPISNYGAMKLASEAQIRAAVEAWLPRADIYRFPNVVGAPATHGVVLDFIRKLKATPQQLDVLGDGTQQKVYVHVSDLVNAMQFITQTATGSYNLFNIGPSDAGATVWFIAETVRDTVSPHARIAFGEGGRGWVGDVPRFRYSVERLAALGWRATYSSTAAIRQAIEEIVRQED